MVVVGFVDKVEVIVAEANQQISPIHCFNDISDLRSTIFEKDNAESLLVLFEFLGTTKADLITQIELIERAIPHAKIVVVSGSADAKIIVEALRLGVLGFISNSTPIKKVLDIICHLDQVTVLCQKRGKVHALEIARANRLIA